MPYGFGAVTEIQKYIVPKQDIAYFLMDIFSVGVYVTLMLEQVYGG